MSSPTGTITQTLYPVLTYRDGAAAIDFLERAFGFERAMVSEGDGGAIAHAELRLGDAFVMLGSASQSGVGMRAPDGPGSQSVYVVVEDPDAVHARAVAAGAEVIRELTDQPYGSREFTAGDPEGHVWSFGTYRPAG